MKVFAIVNRVQGTVLQVADGRGDTAKTVRGLRQWLLRMPCRVVRARQHHDGAVGTAGAAGLVVL